MRAPAIRASPTVRAPAAESPAAARTAAATEVAMPSGKAATTCLQGAIAIRDRCGDSHAPVSVHDLFRHREALRLGIETQLNAR